jgi:23S rRNA pseudouridine1911/1915/1917 synthase
VDGTHRLDTILRTRLPHISRRDIWNAIDAGLVTVNGRACHKGDRIGPGDRIDFAAMLTPPAAPPNLNVPILHRDRVLLVLDKPPGVPTTARRIGGRPSIAGYLLARFPQLAEIGASALEAGLAHRLDTDTSGVLLVARSHAAWQDLRAQFAARRVGKVYLALVKGRLVRPRDLVHDLAHDRRRIGRMVVLPTESASRRGRPSARWQAVMRFVPIESRAGVTLVRIQLSTGVTHQIRAQLAAIGHPVCGDTQYDRGGGRVAGTSRTLLHATRISVEHPSSRRRMAFTSPLAADFAAVLTTLGFAFKMKKPPRP